MHFLADWNRGDEAALKSLIERYQRPVFSMALCLTGCEREKAFALTIASFVETIRSSQTLQKDGAFLQAPIRLVIRQCRGLPPAPAFDLSDLEALPAPKRESLRIVKEAPSGKKDKLLMVVDDEEGIRKMLVKFFGSRNYKVLEAKSGEDALQLAQSQKPAITLLDMHMTGMNGLETLKKLLEIHPGLGVVMATGDANDQMVKQAMELGAYGYVLKPFEFLYLELVVMSKFAIAED